ncbi:hypothetical protein FQN51_006571 [Onygenales sp. PD_10]|nr:hypothetical protein FQN51_006571 [Onygenales sp. PD_10]
MKVPLIFLVALGLASQVSCDWYDEIPWIQHNKEIAYDCWDDHDRLGHVNALKPTHIADVARKFCSGIAQESPIAILGEVKEYRDFEGADGKSTPVLIRVIRRATEEEEKKGDIYSLPPVPVPLDTCVKLMDALIEGCPRKYSSDLTRFGGGTAHIKPYVWSVTLRPEKTNRGKEGRD